MNALSRSPLLLVVALVVGCGRAPLARVEPVAAPTAPPAPGRLFALVCDGDECVERGLASADGLAAEVYFRAGCEQGHAPSCEHLDALVRSASCGDECRALLDWR
jgi:hypothetical protein